MNTKQGISVILLITIFFLPTLAFADGELIGSYGIVNTSRLNMRSGDHIKFASLGVLSGGTRLDVLGRNLDSTWLLVSDGDASGWVHTAFVVLRGMNMHGYPILARASFAPLADNHATVNTSYLNLRAGAGVHYDVIATLSGGTTGKLVGRNADWSWVYIELNDGSEGWVSSHYVLLRGDTVNQTIELLEDSNFASANHAIVNASYLNMRSGDGVQYQVQEILPGGTILQVLGHNEAGNWLYVSHRGREGWVNARHIALRGAGISAYPLVAAAQDAPLAETVAIVNTSFLNIRSGAGVSNDVIAVTAGGNELRVSAIHPNGRWVQVETAEGETGWVSAAYVVIRGPMPMVASHG